MATIDITKNAAANIYALIAAGANNPTLDATKATIGAPSANGTGKNTSVVLTAVAGGGSSGTVTVTYDRVTVSQGVATPDPTYTVPAGQSSADILTAVAAKLGLRADEVNFDVAPTKPGSGNTSTSNLQPNTGSLLYNGSPLQITFTWADPTLDSEVQTKALPGFDAAS